MGTKESFLGLSFRRHERKKSRQHRQRTLRRLLVEQLEDRRLLATGDLATLNASQGTTIFDAEAYVSSWAQNIANEKLNGDSAVVADDSPSSDRSPSAEGEGSLVEIQTQVFDANRDAITPTRVAGVSEYKVLPGERFTIRTRAQDLRSPAQGVYSVYTDINYAAVGSPTTELVQALWGETQTLRFPKGTNNGSFDMRQGTKTSPALRFFSSEISALRNTITTGLSYIVDPSNFRISAFEADSNNGPTFVINFINDLARQDVEELSVNSTINLAGGGTGQIQVSSSFDPATKSDFSSAIRFPLTLLDSGYPLFYNFGPPAGALVASASGFLINDVGGFTSQQAPFSSSSEANRLVNVFDTSFRAATSTGTVEFTINPSGNLGLGVGLYGIDTYLRDSSIVFPNTFRIVVASDLFAVSDTASVIENSGTTYIPVGSNDIFIPGSNFTVTSVSTTLGGSVGIVGGTTNSSAAVSFTPAPGFVGKTSFTYTVINDQVPPKSSTATVTVNVNAQNKPPVAVTDTGADRFTVALISTQRFDLNVLGNDNPGEIGDTIRVTAVTQPTSGTVAIGVNGLNVNYTPAADAPIGGVQSFSYTITDSGGLTSSATVEVFINPPILPFATNDTAVVAQNGAQIDIDVLANDFANVGAIKRLLGLVGSLSPSSAGTLVIRDNNSPTELSDDKFGFTPSTSFSGPATFTYRMDDTSVGSQPSVGTVVIMVGDTNDPPTVINQTVVGVEDMTLTIPSSTILTGSSPGPGESSQTLTVTAATLLSPGAGSIAVTSGNLVFTPTANLNGPVLISYTATDNGTTNGAPDPKSASATITVNVAAVNDPPVAGNDSGTTAEGVPLTLTGTNVLSNDRLGPTDEATQTLSLVSVAIVSGSVGSVALIGGNIVFTPPVFFNGTSSATYVMQDSGTGNPQATGTINFTVTPVNDAPVPIASTRSASASVPIVIDLAVELAQAYRGGGADEASQTVRVNRIIPLVGTRGTISLNSDGTIRYVAPPGFSGADSFDYEVIDNGTTNGVADPKVGIARITVNVQAFQLSTISGRVWVDDDKDGQIDTDEVKLGGVDVELSFVINTGGTGGVIFRRFTTQSDGTYSFGGLSPNSYTVSFTQPQNYVDAPAPNSVTLEIVEPGGINAVVNFQVHRPSANSIYLGNLGTDGVTIYGADAGDNSGVSVSDAGDVNGDGYDDLIIGAWTAEASGNQKSHAGESYVIFGGPSLPSTVDLGNLGAAGITIFGADPGDFSGVSVSGAGDVNGDGFADLLIGADSADAFNNQKLFAGESYLIFGSASLPRTIDLANLNSPTVKIFGAEAGDNSGAQVSKAGDVNGDGFDDLFIASYRAGALGNAKKYAGDSYVVFGSESLPTTIDLANLGLVGMTIFGANANDYSGVALSDAGDLNGDGFDDFVIGTTEVGVASKKAKSYVIFGRASLPATVDLATLGSNGMTLVGVDANDMSGRSVSSAGDVNGDGFDDLLIGAYGGQAAGNLKPGAGESYLIFGSASLASIDLANLGTAGITIFGAIGDVSGISVSGAGDMNADGFDDLLIGAQLGGLSQGTGGGYVVFGGANLPPSIDLGSIGAAGIAIYGIDMGDTAGRSVSRAGDINGDGFDDILIGADKGSGLGNSKIDSGESYILYGSNRFTSSVTHSGIAIAETLTGTSGADVMVGGRGNDTLISNEGLDVMIGGQGDDIFVVSDYVKRIVGGKGIDTIRFDGSGLSLDLTTITDNRVLGIERIDLTGGGDNSLTINKRDVLRLSDTSNTLLIDGNTGDRVDLRDNWSQGTDETIDGKTFRVVSNGSSTIKINAAISLTIITPNVFPESYDVPENWYLVTSDASGKTTTTKRDNGVLANDLGNITGIELVTAPTRGKLNLNADGTFSYRPNSGVVAGQTDSFTYRVLNASTSTSAEATTNLRITNPIWSPHQNPRNRYDVNNDNEVAPLDVLIVINSLRRNGSNFSVRDSLTVLPPYVDVDGDFFAAPIDVLQVINYLNRSTTTLAPANPGGDYTLTFPPNTLNPSLGTTVVLTNQTGISFPITPSKVTATSVTFLVPPYIDPVTFNNVAGKIAVKVEQRSGDQTVFSQSPGIIPVPALPDTGLPPGTLFNAFLVETQLFFKKLLADYKELAAAANGLVDLTPIISGINRMQEELEVLRTAVVSLISGSVASIEIGEDVSMNLDTLRYVDRALKATLLRPQSPLLAVAQLSSRSDGEGEEEDDYVPKDLYEDAAKFNGDLFKEDIVPVLKRARDVGTIGILTASAISLLIPGAGPGLAVTGVGIAGIFYERMSYKIFGAAMTLQKLQAALRNKELDLGDAQESIRTAQDLDILEDNIASIALEATVGVLKVPFVPNKPILSKEGAAIIEATQISTDVATSILQPKDGSKGLADRLFEKGSIIRSNLKSSRLTVEVTSLSFDVPLGGRNTQTQKLKISNPTFFPIKFSAMSTLEEIMLSPESETVPPNESVEIEVTLKERDFDSRSPLKAATETLTGTITITDDGGSKLEPVATEINVTAGKISADKALLIIEAPPSGDGSVELTLSNVGIKGSNVRYSITSNHAGIDVIPVEGSSQRISTDSLVKFNVVAHGSYFSPDSIPNDLALTVKNLDIANQPTFYIPVTVIIQENIRGTYTGNYAGSGEQTVRDFKNPAGPEDIFLTGFVTIKIESTVRSHSDPNIILFSGMGSVTGVRETIAGLVAGQYNTLTNSITLGLVETTYRQAEIVNGKLKDGIITGLLDAFTTILTGGIEYRTETKNWKTSELIPVTLR